MSPKQARDIQPESQDRSPQADQPSLGAWVRRQRRALDLTQDALARRMGYARVTIKKIEGDELRPSQQLAERLAEHLGVPDQDRQAFVQFARRGVAPPAARPASSRRTGELPVQVTSFVGRARELAEVRRLISAHRLVTLTGSGGIGKTRLALEVATAEVDAFADGVWLVELSSLADPQLVPHAVAAALGLRVESAHPVAATLAEFVRARRLLLVMDSCEHLVDACARLAETLLRSSTHVHLLATSREVLGVAGESAYQVPPLSIPLEHSAPAEIARSEAARLFAERAGAVLSAFEIPAQNAAVIAQICRRVDGIPLALELAAARLQILSVEQIAERLADRFRLLTSGSRTALPRHQTLRALIDWSYELLSAPERLLFQRLSVFAGGCTLEAAERVARSLSEDSSSPPQQAADVLDLLSRLAGKSLILAEHGSGEARYSMLETIRQYAHEKLAESHESELMHLRHLTYFADWCESIKPEPGGPAEMLWFDRLEIEHNNLLSAIEWAFANGQIEMGLRLAVALTPFWNTRGYLSDGRRWLEVGLSQTSSVSEATRAWALHSAGSLARAQGESARATRLHEQGLAIFRALRDSSGIVASLLGLGLAALGDGQPDVAQVRIEECLVVSRQLGDKRAIALSLDFLGHAVRNQGNFDRARLLYEQSLKMFQEMGDKRQIAYLLTSMGHLAMRSGDTGTWRLLTERGLTMRRELKDKYGEAVSLSILGRIAFLSGKYDQAESYTRQSLLMNRDLGSPSGIVMNLIILGAIAKDRATARPSTKTGARRPGPEKRAQAASEAHWLRAARLFAAVEPLQDAALNDYRTFYQEMLADLRTQGPGLGKETFARGWEEGQAMELEQAVAYALDEIRL